MRDILDLCCSVMACAQCTENEVEDSGCPELISEQKCSECEDCYRSFFVTFCWENNYA